VLQHSHHRARNLETHTSPPPFPCLPMLALHARTGGWVRRTATVTFCFASRREVMRPAPYTPLLLCVHGVAALRSTPQ
jgi:hypothetical protein